MGLQLLNSLSVMRSEFKSQSYSLPDDFVKVPLSSILSGKGVSINMSTINQQRSGYVHRAIDIVAPVGTSVLSPGTGVVSEVKPNNGAAGNMLILNFPVSKITITLMHLNTILVKKQAAIELGQLIATSGNTGRSTGPHLHIQATHDGVRIDPLLVFELDLKQTA